MADFTEKRTTDLLLQFSNEFDQLCGEQLMGIKRDHVITEDLQGALFAELISVSNVARHLFMKIRYLQARIAEEDDVKPLDLNLSKDFKKDV